MFAYWSDIVALELYIQLRSLFIVNCYLLMFIAKYPCGEARERELERVRDRSNMDCVAPMIRKAHYSRTSRPNKHTHFISQGFFPIFGEPRIN